MKALLLGFSALVFLAHGSFAEEKCTIACSYDSNDADHDTAELQPRGRCAFLRGGRVFISSASLSKLNFSKKGLASVSARGYGWLFVRRDGSTIPSVRFDYETDPFVEGVARYTSHGKVGFINESGDVVIRARFGFAFPFTGGRAVVCNGCTEVKAGEYSVVRGGRWGCIDKRGRIIIPIKRSEEEGYQMLRAMDSRASG